MDRDQQIADLERSTRLLIAENTLLLAQQLNRDLKWPKRPEWPLIVGAALVGALLPVIGGVVLAHLMR